MGEQASRACGGAPALTQAHGVGALQLQTLVGSEGATSGFLFQFYSFCIRCHSFLNQTPHQESSFSKAEKTRTLPQGLYHLLSGNPATLVLSLVPQASWLLLTCFLIGRGETGPSGCWGLSKNGKSRHKLSPTPLLPPHPQPCKLGPEEAPLAVSSSLLMGLATNTLILNLKISENLKSCHLSKETVLDGITESVSYEKSYLVQLH